MFSVDVKAPVTLRHVVYAVLGIFALLVGALWLYGATLDHTSTSAALTSAHVLARAAVEDAQAEGEASLLESSSAQCEDRDADGVVSHIDAALCRVSGVEATVYSTLPRVYEVLVSGAAACWYVKLGAETDPMAAGLCKDHVPANPHLHTTTCTPTGCVFVAEAQTSTALPDVHYVWREATNASGINTEGEKYVVSDAKLGTSQCETVQILTGEGFVSAPSEQLCATVVT